MVAAPSRYVIFYDGRCRFCTNSRRTVGRLPARAELQFVDINDARLMSRYPTIDPHAAQGQMFVLSPDGSLAGGFDAIVALLPALSGLRRIRPLLSPEPVRRVGRTLYRWVARNRYRLGGMTTCADGACRVAN
jgi:predicted DCC family thiol-disulfide oxidoreductase YuxK